MAAELDGTSLTGTDSTALDSAPPHDMVNDSRHVGHKREVADGAVPSEEATGAAFTVCVRHTILG